MELHAAGKSAGRGAAPQGCLNILGMGRIYGPSGQLDQCPTISFYKALQTLAARGFKVAALGPPRAVTVANILKYSSSILVPPSHEQLIGLYKHVRCKNIIIIIPHMACGPGI